ncbi:MAG: substrate-binding domain-containing protein [Defluviitaleaceae bacterium]|nr:substrate-binding domain-containing protein [Defluviitaleaceae bacterium]
MKKNVFIIAVLAICAMVFAACGGNDGATPVATPTPAPQQEQAPATGEETADAGQEATPEADAFSTSEIVVVVPAAAQGWIAAVHFFADIKGSELLAEGLGGFRVLASQNVAEQAGQLEELISQNVDVIVLFPHSDELDFAAQAVVDANIPLFVFNRNVNVDFNSRLLGSNDLIGRESANKIAEVIGGEGVVAYISVPAVGSTNVDRLTPFHEVMATFPGIELVTMTTTAISMEEALTVTTDMLTANPHIDAIFTIDDQLSMGALQAIREAGRTDIQAMNGAGGMQLYFQEILDEQDIYLFTATFSPTMIMDTIDLAVDYLRGRRDFPNITIIPPEIVTRNNAQNFIVADSPW